MPSIHLADEGYIREQRNWQNAQRSVSQGVTRAGMFVAGLTEELKALEAKRQQAKNEVDAVSYMNGLRDVTNKFMIEHQDSRDYHNIQDKYTEAVNKYHEDFKKLNKPSEEAFKMIDRQALNYVGNMRVNVTNRAMKNDSMFQVSRVEAVNTDILHKADVNNFEIDFAHYKKNQEILWKYQGKPADEVIKLQDEGFQRQYFVSAYSKTIASTPVEHLNNDLWHGNSVLTEKDKHALDVELQRKQNDLKKEQQAYVKDRADVVYESLRKGEPVTPAVFDEIAKYNKPYAYQLQKMYENVTKNGTKSRQSISGLISQDNQTLANINMALDDEALPYSKKVEVIQGLSTKLQTSTGINKFLELVDAHNDVMKQLNTGEKADMQKIFKAVDDGFGLTADVEAGEDPRDAKYARTIRKEGLFWGYTDYDAKKSLKAANDVKIHLKNYALMLKTQGKPVTLDILNEESERYLKPYLEDMTRDQIMQKAVPWKPFPFRPNPAVYGAQISQPSTITKDGKTYVLGKDGKYYLENK